MVCFLIFCLFMYLSDVLYEYNIKITQVSQFSTPDRRRHRFHPPYISNIKFMEPKSENSETHKKRAPSNQPCLFRQPLSSLRRRDPSPTTNRYAQTQHSCACVCSCPAIAVYAFSVCPSLLPVHSLSLDSRECAVRGIRWILFNL